MSRKSGLERRFPNLPAMIGGARPVARLFVPGYGKAGAIVLRRRGNARAFARRLLGRLIEPRRLSS